MGEIMQIWNIQKELILNDCDLRQKVPAALPKQPFLSKMQMVNYLWQWLEVHGYERLFTFKRFPRRYFTSKYGFLRPWGLCQNKLQNKAKISAFFRYLFPSYALGPV